ncbi:MAG: histidine kinase [Bacteroidota bacterium]|nr:histidine kinase [Bacteroidota bacterium]
MRTHEFIFSDKLKPRLARHIALWVAFSFYFFIVNFFPRNAHDFVVSKTYVDAFHKLIYIPISVFSVYVSIYFLLPRFILKGKYFLFFILFVCLCLINLTSAWLLTKLLVQLTQQIPFQQLPIQIRIFQPVIYGLGLGLAASGFAIIIKLLKIRYLKQKENERLQEQKISTELQMIKTNFHPHFLSGALQNISELIRHNSTQSLGVILKLSDLLSFILYENEQASIPLEQELLMVRDYLELEKTFYGNRIMINLKEPVDITGKTVAPLILLSLVQNCCEQFLISLQQKLSIDIETEAEENHFTFRLSCNGYYENINGIPGQNTGLNHALKRIQVVYPKKHRLETHSENGFFSMELIIESEVIANPLKKIQKKILYESA